MEPFEEHIPEESPYHSRLEPRKPVFAILLSIAQPGLGHLYCGKSVKGIKLLLLNLVLTPIFMFLLKYVSFIIAIVAINIGLVLIIFFYSVIDSFLLARVEQEYRLKKYNKWYFYLLVVVVGLCISFGTELYSKNHVIASYRTPTSSMVPSLLKGDHFLVNKSKYDSSIPERGDIVVFTSPDRRNIDYIKRVIALPGDIVEVKNNRVYLNGTSLKRHPVQDESLSLIKDQLTGDVFFEENTGRYYQIMIEKNQMHYGDIEKTEVPNEHYFVLGDNRTNSLDSRVFGSIPMTDIKGRLEFIHFPAETWKRFGEHKESVNPAQ